MFLELQDRGFIRTNVVGAFNLKVDARRGNATSWILTEFPIGDSKGAGTKDFMRWRPRAENHSTVPTKGQGVTAEGTVPFKPRPSVPPKVTLSAENPDRRSLVGGHR